MPGPTYTFCAGWERDEVDDGDGAVGGGDVGVNAQAGTKERGATFAKKNDDEGSEQDDEEKVEAEAFEVGHWMKQFYMRGEVEWKLVAALTLVDGAVEDGGDLAAFRR